MPDAGGQKKKRKLWEVDPTVYETLRRLGPLGRVLELSRSLGRIVLYILLIGYPLILPIIGVAFGPVVFWGTFAGSVSVIAFLVSKFGYAKNFDRQDFPFLKSLLGICGGFFCAAGFFLGLFYLSWFVIPIFAGLLGLIFFVVLRKQS